MHHGDPHQVSPIAKPDKILKLDGISPESVEAHWGLYEGYVKKYNEIQEKLHGADRGAANQIYSDYRGFRSAITFAIGGIKNHELYFQNLGGGGSPSDALAAQVEKDFGGPRRRCSPSFAPAAWPRAAGRGWRTTGTGPSSTSTSATPRTPSRCGTPRRSSRSTCTSTPTSGTSPRRGPKYIDAFVANIDWADVSARWERIASVL